MTMRELKFRAWDKQDKRMIVDQQDFIPLLVTNKGVFRLNPHHQEPLWVLVEGDRFEIMQHLGMCDRTHKDLYMGDVIKSECYETIGKKYVIDDMASFNYLAVDLALHMDDFEIIGNIHENPELLEETR
jgi:hypothetical protein